VLVMLALFSTSTTGANLLNEMVTGSHERLLVTPLSRPSLLIGRALKEIAPTLVQSALVMAIAFPFGFSFSPLGAVAGLLMLSVFSIGLGSMSYALALAIKGREWMFWLVQQTLLFPMMILAGILLPLDSGPAWLKIAATFNPLSHVAAAQRALFSGNFSDQSVIAGAIAAAIMAAVGLFLGVKGMKSAS
jgi:ABC-2 type transport system permease protein